MRALPLIIGILIFVGVVSSTLRAIYPASLAERAEPIRRSLLRSVGSSDPLASQRPDVLMRFDARFGNHPVMTYVHVVLGSLFLLAAPVQFSKGIRDRNRRLHRWCGRALITCGTLIVVSGLFFGVGVPFAGTGERIIVALAGLAFIVSISVAIVSIRRGQIARHRAWMVRAYAVMLGISTVRIAAAILDPLLSPLAISVEMIFVISLWIGWGGTFLAAELWLRSSSPLATKDIAKVQPAI